MDTTVDDVWDWWSRALADPSRIGTPDLPLHSEPQFGFFRVRDRDGNWQPVQFWHDGSLWQASRGEKNVIGELPIVGDPETLWTFACRNPISEVMFDNAVNHKGWPDEPERGIGQKNAPDDPVIALMQEYNTEIKQAEALLATPIDSQAVADKVAILAKRISGIKSRADDGFRVEKAPALAEAKRIDNRWRDVRDLPEDLARRLKKHSDAWLKELARRERERRIKAEEEAERLRKEAAEKMRAAERANDPTGNAVLEAGQALADLKEAQRQAEPQKVSAGRTGARLSLRTFYSAEIVDQDVLYHAVRTDPLVIEALQTIADRAARAKLTLPGMAIVKEEKSV